MISNASAGNGTPTSSSVTPMRPPSRAAMPPVGAACEHAAAGDGVAVDRGHHRLRKEEHRVVEPVQRRQKSPDVGRAALAQPHQIDAGGKHPALPGQHHGPVSEPAQRLELRGERLAEFDVERVGLAVNHLHDGDAAAMAQFDHVVPRARSAERPAPRAPACRGASRSAWITAIVSTTIAMT